jgi:hypothetical protein
MRARCLLVQPLVVAVLGLAAYALALRFEFVYDDRWTIVENRWLGRPLLELVPLLASGAAVARGVPDATRPLMVLGHALERRCFGLAAWGYHLDSVLSYAVVCALATQVAFVLSRRRAIALTAGCFFALAPLHAEVVAVVNYREDLFASFGTLVALAALFGPVGLRATRADSLPRALFAGTCLLLGLCGKESGLASVPLAGLIAFVDPRARREALAKRRTLWVLVAVVAAWLVWRVPLAVAGDGLPLAPHRSALQLLLRTTRYELRAVWASLWPFGFKPDYWRQADATFASVIPCASLVLGVIALARNPRTRLPALGVGFALVAPLATSPLVRPINELADRYFFLGPLGGGLVWGWIFARLGARWRPALRYVVLAAACLPLLLMTERAAAVWRSDRTLWTAAVARTPSSPRAWAALADVYRSANDQAGTDTAIQRALSENPNYPPALVGEVYADLTFGRLELGREHLANIAARRLGHGGGLEKAERCATLDRDAAALCIRQ